MKGTVKQVAGQGYTFGHLYGQELRQRLSAWLRRVLRRGKDGR